MNHLTQTPTWPFVWWKMQQLRLLPHRLPGWLTVQTQGENRLSKIRVECGGSKGEREKCSIFLLTWTLFSGRWQVRVERKMRFHDCLMREKENEFPETRGKEASERAIAKAAFIFAGRRMWPPRPLCLTEKRPCSRVEQWVFVKVSITWLATLESIAKETTLGYVRRCPGLAAWPSDFITGEFFVHALRSKVSGHGNHKSSLRV